MTVNLFYSALPARHTTINQSALKNRRLDALKFDVIQRVPEPSTAIGLFMHADLESAYAVLQKLCHICTELCKLR